MFLKTPCSQKIIVLDVSWNSFDGKIGSQTPFFFQTSKNHLRIFLDFSDKKTLGKTFFFPIPFVRQNSQLKSVLEQFWSKNLEDITIHYNFSNTPCSETILILETPWHSSDRKIGGTLPVFQYTMPLKVPS